MSETPYNEHAPGQDAWENLRKWAGRAVMVGAVLAPVGGVELGAYLAPGATVSTPIAGAEVDVQAVPGSNVINANLQLANVQRYSRIRAGTKDIGANVTFHFNNVSLTNAQGIINRPKLKLIAQEFSDVQPEVTEIKKTLSNHYGNWAAGGGLLVAGSELAARAYLIARRRKLAGYPEEKQRHVSEDRKWLDRFIVGAMGASALGIPGAAVGVYFAPNHPQVVHPDKALVGTALAGYGVSGPAKPAVDAAVPWANKFFPAKNAFYGAEDKSLDADIQALYGVASVAPIVGQKRIILADDIQGEDGTARLTGDVARAYNADLIVVGGDITATGSPLETPVLDALQSHAGGIPVQASLGHHDPPPVAQMVLQRHMHLADGRVHDINGINIEGVNSPDVIPFAGTPYLRKSAFTGETIDQATQLLINKTIEQACSLKSPAIFEMHDQVVGTALAQANCPNLALVLTGRQSPPHPPVKYGTTTEFISGSTGAHSSAPTIQAFGIIHAPGIIEEITINNTYQVISSDLITLEGPSTGVVITNNLADEETPVDAAANPPVVAR